MRDIDLSNDLFIKQPVLNLLPQLDALVFDVDGVIVDVSGTFRVVICQAAELYGERFLGFEPGPLLRVTEVELFKAAGGFNNDWDLCSAVVLLYVVKSLTSHSRQSTTLREVSPTLAEYTEEIGRRGGGLAAAEEYLVHGLTPDQRRELSSRWTPRLITQICEELYAGDDHCVQLYGREPEHVHGPGLCEQEPVLLRPETLPAGRKLGVLTGRTREETRFALGRAGLIGLIPEAHWVTHDDGVKKPEGRALWEVYTRLNFKLALYVGDTLDDLRTVGNYRTLKVSDHAKVLSGLVLTGPAGVANRQTFLERGAEIVAPDVNAILTYLKHQR